LAEAANRTKKGGQDLIGGLDVRVNRNHFGRQAESFIADLDLPFLASVSQVPPAPFQGIFIRAPVVEKLLPVIRGEQAQEAERRDTVIAPAQAPADSAAAHWFNQAVEVMGSLPHRTARSSISNTREIGTEKEAADIIAVRQGNVFGTSFHPELTQDFRMHLWWLSQVRDAVGLRRKDAWNAP